MTKFTRPRRFFARRVVTLRELQRSPHLAHDLGLPVLPPRGRDPHRLW